MKKLTFIFCSLLIDALAQAAIIHIPADYPTIQQGIDAAVIGDTVLVDPGTYVENIILNEKNITVASLFLTTQNKAYISQTIIDGNQAGSVVTFNYCYETTTRLSGFTIRNGLNSQGYGGGIYLEESSPTLDNLIITNNSVSGGWYGGQGGGMFCGYYSNPVLKNILITGNSADNGGGIYFYYYNFPILENVTITDNTASYGGGIYFYYSYPVFDSVHRCNIYQNTATYGSDLYNSDSYQKIPVILNKFTVKKPKSAQVYLLFGFTFDILQGVIPQDDIILYVSPGGDDNNSGVTVNNPMKTIHHALEVVNADPIDLYDIYLLNGTYSPDSNGEIFPLNLPDYMGLYGESEEGVVLDADSTARVISITEKSFVEVSAMTITGGYSGGGGGIYIYNSGPVLNNLTIRENTTDHSGGWGTGTPGGGIYCYSGNPVLKNLSIYDNSATSAGGGICFDYSNPVFDSVFRCSIYENNAQTGNDLYSSNAIEIALDTFTVIYPKSIQAYPLSNFYFDINHGKFPQENIVLYASPTGDDNNSGLSESQALKTISHALGIANSDPINLFDIHLSDGTYSPSATGEVFPISLPDYLSLAGESINGVILDAEGQSQVIVINQSGSVEISNLTITGGNAQNYYYGGGIYCNNASPIIQNVNIQGNNGYYGGGMFCSYNSSPKIEDVTFFDNYAEYYGGGIYCEGNTFPVLKNVTISTNSANYGGGGLHLSSSNPKLENVTITENSADYGGGIYFSYSFPVFDSINRCNIYLNNASAGNDLYSDYGNVSVVLDTFSVLHPTQFFASPLSNFIFDVLNGKIEQVDADLYVSPDGDNANSGLTANDPLKTIRFAMIRMLADSLHPHTVHLLDGTYSPSGNGDIFPVYVTDYVKLLGSSSSDVILDAEGLSGVVEMRNNTGSGLSNLTISGGSAEYGGGIYLEYSSPALDNLEIINNVATGEYNANGGGIYCRNSSPLIENSTISSNQAINSGGGIYCESYSNAIIRNVTFSTNSAFNGGGIYLSYDSNPVIEHVNLSENSAYSGGGMYCTNYTNPTLNNLNISNNSADHLGAGIYFYYSSPVLENSILSYNIAQSAGGIYFYYSNPVLKNVTISKNTASNKGGGFYAESSNPVFDTANRCNIYLNLAQTGKDCYSNYFLDVAVDTFTVLHPKTYHASPLSNFSFDILHGMIPQQDVVLYASPEGDDGNSGLSENDPLKTIQHAIEVSNSDSVNLFTIQLKNGIYSPSSTGEVFPLSFVDYGNLIGESEAGTILDAEGQSEVIHLDGSNFGEISNLTISGGHASAKGGGIYSYNSSALLKNLSITGNVTNYQGGGMYCYNSNLVLQNIKISNNEANNGGGIYCDASNPEFENITISGNSATNFGGGIFLNQSNPVMLNTSIINNNSFMGGGIYCSAGTNPILKNTSVFNNSAETGGGIYLYYSNPVFDTINRSNIYMNFAETGNDLFADFSTAHVVVDTFSVLYPTAIFASPLANFTFDILHGKIEQIEADHYVSPTGDNNNSGLTADEPLKTIRFAMVKILADSLHPHTIRLQEGIYSPSRTNEKFPITLIDYVSLSGISQGNVILDAEKRSRVIQLNNNKGSGISNLTITHGFGGLYCNNSSPVIQNITFFDNKADYGGGMYLDNSNPSLTNVALYENQATKGSSIYCYGSNPLMVNTTIVNNLNTNAYGGGIYCGAGSNAKIVNSILWNNSPHEVVLQGVYSPNSVEISYSDIMDGENGIFINGVGTVNWLEGNINEDPIFVGSGNHLYQVSDLSPCIDAGTPDTTGLNLPEYDLAGNPRFVNGRVDMGAYEWNSMFEQDEAITGTIGFEVYPNPVKDFFFVEFSSRPQTAYLFEMYNTCGNMVKSVSGKTSSSENYQLKINTANLQPGLYFIRLQAGNQMATKKVVKL